MGAGIKATTAWLRWGIDGAWFAAAGFMFARGDWAGFTICLTGLAGTMLITLAIRSRGRRGMYPGSFEHEL